MRMAPTRNRKKLKMATSLLSMLSQQLSILAVV